MRDTEACVKRLTNQDATGTANAERTAEPRARNVEAAKDVHTRAAEDRMRFALGTKVRIVRRGTGGTVEVDFTSETELNRIYEFITSK